MGLLQNPIGWFSELFGSKNSDGSTRITESTALSYPPAWYAVNKIAGHVAQMPLVLKKRVDDGAEPANEHAAYRAMKVRPNTYQTAATFKSQLMLHYLLWGNARAAIFRSGQTMEILPLLPYDTITVWDQGEKWHATKLQRDSRLSLIEDMLEDPNSVVSFRDSDVLHIPALSSNGITGIGVMEVGQRALAMGIDAEKHVAKGLSKGFNGKAMLEAPAGAFRDEAKAKEFLDSFNSRHKGSDGEEIGMLREGIKMNILQSTSRDSQLIEQRIFQRQDAALLFMLESIIGDDSSVSYNSLEQKNLAYLVNCLGVILVKWEEECNEKLLTQAEKSADSHFFKFNTASLLRTDYPTTITTLSQALQARIITRNEAREKLDMNTVQGGDEFENPNIDTRQGGSAVEDQADDTSAENQQQVDARVGAIRNVLNQMLNVEKKRVVGAIDNKDFDAWADRFYSKWYDRMANVVFDLGGDEALAKAHCESHKQAIKAIYGVATKDTFLAEIQQVVDGWSVDSMIQAILEDAVHV